MWSFLKSHPCDLCKTHTGRLDDMESQVRRLRGEWEDYHEKMLRLAGRITKRAEREAGIDAVPGPAASLPVSTVMAEVLKRRAPRRGPTDGE